MRMDESEGELEGGVSDYYIGYEVWYKEDLGLFSILVGLDNEWRKCANFLTIAKSSWFIKEQSLS